MKKLFVLLLLILIISMNSNTNRQLRKKFSEKGSKSFQIVENDLMKSKRKQNETIETIEKNENENKKPKRKEFYKKGKKESKIIDENNQIEQKMIPIKKGKKMKKLNKNQIKENDEKRKIQNVSNESKTYEKKPKRKEEDTIKKLQKEVDRGIDIPKPKETISEKKPIYTPFEGLLRMNVTVLKIRKSLPQSEPERKDNGKDNGILLEPSTSKHKEWNKLLDYLK